MNFHFSFLDGEMGTGMVNQFQVQYLKYEFDCIPLASQLTTDFVKISIVGGGNTPIAFSLTSKKSQALALFWINMEISGS